MMIKNECRHAYKMLDHAECLWCEDCVEKLVNRIQKPKVSRAFIWKMVDDSVFILHQERYEFYKKKFKEAGVEVEE